jgi:drug/metabolite transporter (DMT)-like permease
MTSQALRSGVVAPFATVTLIWSSTWIVIRDSLGVVPPAWSVCYRFALAAVGMAVLAKLSGASLRLAPRAIGFAGLLGISQFTLNFNLLYRAEAHLTSGLCALVYALLMIPNSLFAWAVFGQRVSRAFLLGSGIAVAGIGLLFLNEYRASITAAPAEVLLGLGLCTTAVLFASIANVMQASQIARSVPMTSLVFWAMAIGALVDVLFAFATTGWPPFDPRPAYWLGTAYLAIAGSVITFPLYFRLIQRIGAGPAAYSSLLIPIIAMAISTAAEGYRWTALAVSGVLLALGGMGVALHARFRQAGG